jgi:hypothetical protein
MTVRRFGVVANVLAILIAFALVWEPEIAAYWVSPFDDPPRSTIEHLRSVPSDDVLEEIGLQRLGFPAGGVPGHER